VSHTYCKSQAKIFSNVLQCGDLADVTCMECIGLHNQNNDTSQCWCFNGLDDIILFRLFLFCLSVTFVDAYSW